MPVPAGLLDRARAVALEPARRPLPRWLAAGMAMAAAVAVLAVAGTLALRPGDSAPAGGGSARSACPITVPTGSLVAPTGPPNNWPAEPPARYGARWYGTLDLWTMLDVGGEAWDGILDTGQKTFWWSRHYRGSPEEQTPDITVTVRSLDGAGPAETFGGPGTNAAADFGAAMLVGVEFPSTGCWELTGTYKGHSLSYVVNVR